MPNDLLDLTESPTAGPDGTSTGLDGGPAGGSPCVLYLAHDLDDSAIWRRVRMGETAGARVTVAGFRRREGPLPRGCLLLGRTRDGRLLHRVVAVARTAARLFPVLRRLDKPQVIVARNLEMLALAALARRAWGGSPVRLAYEVLDIHRAMIGPSARARALRCAERRLGRDAALVLVSSPGFVRSYFDKYGLFPGRTLLIENKILGAAPACRPAPTGGPLAIGWFGVLRCRWTMETLDALTRSAPGRYRIMVRGHPALDQMPDFHEVMGANPDLHYGGPYRNPEDLARIYGEVRIVWMADRYDAGLNSDWLLPNRLYEGGSQGRIPLALDRTEVAAFLRRNGIGLVLPGPNPMDAQAVLSRLSEGDLAGLERAMRAVPASTWVMSDDECRTTLAAILGRRVPDAGRDRTAPADAQKEVA